MLPSEPALLIDEHLVIADVHIGFESGFASGGICLGKESSARKSAQRILKMMKESKSDSLVLLGDIKSGTSKITDYEWRNVPQFFDELGDIDIILVPGNHDGNISRLVPDTVSISSQSGVIIDGVLLTHGHAMPSVQCPQGIGDGNSVLTTPELAESFVKTIEWSAKNKTTIMPLEPYREDE